MAYGRLDVFWPDGKFESFTLVDDSVSVGRATGNTVCLDTDSISRYHFSITYDASRILVTDLESANGTFVDGVKLLGNEPRVVRGVEEIQIGQLRLILHPFDDSPTIPLGQLSEETIRVDSIATDFYMTLDTVDLAVWPASSNSAELAIVNTTDEERLFSISVEGLPEKWVRINRPEALVEGKETAYILLNIKPVRRSDTQPGTYPLHIRVTPKDEPQAAVQADLKVHVYGFGGFGIAMDSRKLASDGRITLHLHNQGSEELKINLKGRDDSDRLVFKLPTNALSIDPGKRLKITCGIQGKNRRIFGTIEEQPFVIMAQALNASGFVASVEGKAPLQPILPIWAGAVIGLGLFVGVALLLLQFAGVFAGRPEPILENVTFNANQVAQTDPLQVSWIAENIDSFSIRIDATPIYEDLPADQTEILLDMSGRTGEVVVDVVGLQDNLQVMASSTITVYEPMVIEVFEVIPSQFVRNTVQNLDIQWQVAHADGVQLEGLQAFSTSAELQPDYAPVDQLAGIAGTATEAFDIVLYAYDLFGNTIQKTLTIGVIDPQCTAIEGVQLREGPSELNQVTSTIEAGVSLVVDAQDITSSWIRMSLPGGVFGWVPVSVVQCDEFFDVSTLRTEVNVPPTLTPTPVPTDTPQPTTTPTPEPTATAATDDADE